MSHSEKNHWDVWSADPDSEDFDQHHGHRVSSPPSYGHGSPSEGGASCFRTWLKTATNFPFLIVFIILVVCVSSLLLPMVKSLWQFIVSQCQRELGYQDRRIFFEPVFSKESGIPTGAALEYKYPKDDRNVSILFRPADKGKVRFDLIQRDIPDKKPQSTGLIGRIMDEYQDLLSCPEDEVATKHSNRKMINYTAEFYPIPRLYETRKPPGGFHDPGLPPPPPPGGGGRGGGTNNLMPSSPYRDLWSPPNTGIPHTRPGFFSAPRHQYYESTPGNQVPTYSDLDYNVINRRNGTTNFDTTYQSSHIWNNNNPNQGRQFTPSMRNGYTRNSGIIYGDFL